MVTSVLDCRGHHGDGHTTYRCNQLSDRSEAGVVAFLYVAIISGLIGDLAMHI